MTRAQRFGTGLGAAVLVYALLWLDILPLPLVSNEVKWEILPVIPWWVLVSTGSYLLYGIGWGLYNFNDVPQAYDDLMVDIKDAKEYLGSRGVDI
ncbi:dolichol-phosphate mannosyltransferase subunit 3 [Ceraceosorus guamensis]|uniref:Dolichol-phosphate mannosyltransferase subunit 3 n=1 Tax=Ceraceosorus guamensis TaxID=1522189 RepID=A0A316W6P5_9BASI|nr:dolichol-phosphate mannosyltransferase subunit 3 [Ceraceosorus guamensis]PWN44788.1 dolichol-phosphate mannosyltransferase subunit 3 [Ceraceosorus guamensis]